MAFRIVEDDRTHLDEYARVSIGFLVTEVFDDFALRSLLRGTTAAGTALAAPYWKDYDASPGNHPIDWPRRFDLSRWTILAAFSTGTRVGGAVVAYDDPEIDLLGDCRDCALLWDLRVATAARSGGVGSALLRAAEEVAVGRGASALRVETQQINVPACRFYAGRGFRLERVVPGAYSDLPDETQLLWRKELKAECVAAE